MAILSLEEIEENVQDIETPVEEIQEFPVDELQDVQQDVQSLEDATELLQDMEEAAQQQAVTINNIEGDASDINSTEDGEEPSVEPEFTQDDLDNNPEMVQDVVNEQQATMEAFAVRLTEASGKNVRSKLFRKFGLTAVSQESIRVNPYEAYKLTHEGLKESISTVVKKIKEWILKLLSNFKKLYIKFKQWLIGNKVKNKEIIKEAEKNVTKIKKVEVIENNNDKEDVNKLLKEYNEDFFSKSNTIARDTNVEKSLKIDEDLIKKSFMVYFLMYNVKTNTQKAIDGIANKLLGLGGLNEKPTNISHVLGDIYRLVIKRVAEENNNSYPPGNITSMLINNNKVKTLFISHNEELYFTTHEFDDLLKDVSKEEIKRVVTSVPISCWHGYNNYEKVIKELTDTLDKLQKNIDDDRNYVDIRKLTLFTSFYLEIIFKAFPAGVKICKHINSFF